MTPENFCYWLQGFFEITGKVESLSKQQVEMIQRHLTLVFTNVTGKPVKTEDKNKISELLDQLMKGGSDLVKVQTCADPSEQKVCSTEPKKSSRPRYLRDTTMC